MNFISMKIVYLQRKVGVIHKLELIVFALDLH